MPAYLRRPFDYLRIHPTGLFAVGQLQFVSACGGPCAAGDLRSLDVHPTGRFVFALRATFPFSGRVLSFSVNPGDGALTYLDAYRVGGDILESTTRDTFDAALETTGRFLYVTAQGRDPNSQLIREIRIVRLNPLTGGVDGESIGARVRDLTFGLGVSGPIR